MPELEAINSVQRPDGDCFSGAARDGVVKHLLPKLPAASLAALRQTCRSVRDMVDHGTDSAWRRAARPLVSAPPPAGTSALGVQAILRRGAAARRGIVEGGAPVATLPLTAVAHDPCGQRLAGLDPDQHVVVASSSLDGPRRATALGACDAVAWSADGKNVFAYSTDRSMALRLDVAAWRVDAAIEVAHFPAMWAGPPGAARAPLWTHAAFSPDGRLLAYVDHDERVAIRHLSSGHRRWGPAPRPSAWLERTLTWSPDSAFLAVSRQVGKSLPGEILRAEAPACPWLPFRFMQHGRWSPDGRAFAYYDGDRMRVVEVGDRRWVAEAAQTIGASWSDDGSLLALKPKRASELDVVFTTSDWARQRHPPTTQGDSLPTGAKLDGLDFLAARLGDLSAKFPPTALPTRGSGASGRQVDVDDLMINDMIPCPWPRAKSAAALLLSDERVVVLDIDADAVTQVCPPISPTRTGARPGRFFHGSKTVLHWSKSDHTLALHRPNGLQVIDFAGASPGAAGTRTRPPSG